MTPARSEPANANEVGSTVAPFRSDDGGGIKSKRPVLCVVHQPQSTPGRIGLWLKKAGYSLDIRRPRFGDPLPETLDEHDGAVIFGGPMSANDGDDFVRQEIDWIGVALEEQRPFLGVCLGAQMLAKHLGAAVGPHVEERVEIGYHPIFPTPDGERLTSWPKAFYQWHREGFELPDGAVQLASTPSYPNQAMSYGVAALGVQFHPEITFSLVNRWTSSSPERLELVGAHPRGDHFRGHHSHTASIGAWLDRVMPMWLAGKLAAGTEAPLLAAAE